MRWAQWSSGGLVSFLHRLGARIAGESAYREITTETRLASRRLHALLLAEREMIDARSRRLIHRIDLIAVRSQAAQVLSHFDSATVEIRVLGGSGNYLLTFGKANSRGTDPENFGYDNSLGSLIGVVDATSGVPTLRSYTVGLNISF